jgi:hypothetical protein
MQADVLLFGGFLLWAVLDRISVGKRPVVRQIPGAPPGRFNLISWEGYSSGCR